MRQDTRTNRGPRPTPRPGEVTMEFEPIRVNPAKLAIAGAAVVIGLAVGVNYGIDRINSGPTQEQIDKAGDQTKPEGYNPDKANPSGVPTSGNESE
ncbi:MAG: hypothetical protein H6799_00330 [Candidatus Nomurabacteria bacterium]|nr:MAG: hypothetical protein H6799_00330 [Candidatus Nomurabacteria bacterium]HRV76377.1 hypothetical protein [Candidatus Saccharimonadales bacterium]